MIVVSAFDFSLHLSLHGANTLCGRRAWMAESDHKQSDVKCADCLKKQKGGKT